MLPRDRGALLDILEQIRLLSTRLDGVSHDAFLLDGLRQDTAVLHTAIIGEAATRLSEDFRSAHPSIPWRKIRGMRNFLIHVYDQIDYEIVWNVIQQDLAPLRAAVEALLAADPEDAEEPT